MSLLNDDDFEILLARVRREVYPKVPLDAAQSVIDLIQAVHHERRRRKQLEVFWAEAQRGGRKLDEA